MYSAFARLNYQPWYAIAEFIDNSLQSFLANRVALSAAGTNQLVVDVEIEPDLIRVRDNAAGIATTELHRAFSPAMPPPDVSGLSEFGIGMKAAASWFSEYWIVRSSAVGEAVEREVVFDLPEIISSGREYLPITERPADPSDHYTVLELTSLRVQPRSRTLTKIRDHLSSIFRVFLREGTMRLNYITASLSEALSYQEPRFLEAMYFREADSAPLVWRKDIEIDVGGGQAIRGWAGLLATASTRNAGFAVFRRGRLIQGSGDQTWRPERVFGSPNSYPYQRLTGELHVEGFAVTHTKDGIQWGDVEDAVLDLIAEAVDSEPLPLVKQAEGYRVRKDAASLKLGYGSVAVDTTGDALARHAPRAIDLQLQSPASRPRDMSANPTQIAQPDETAVELAEVLARKSVSFVVEERSRQWNITVQLVRNRAEEWFSYSRGASEDDTADVISISLNLDHPFSEAFLNESESVLTPMMRIVAALALAEINAVEVGTEFAGRVRRNFNELLRRVFSEPAEGA
jgi:hypothetical protein